MVAASQVGLDAAGKTTILYKLKLGEIVTTIPTIGKDCIHAPLSTPQTAPHNRFGLVLLAVLSRVVPNCSCTGCLCLGGVSLCGLVVVSARCCLAMRSEFASLVSAAGPGAYKIHALPAQQIPFEVL